MRTAACLRCYERKKGEEESATGKADEGGKGRVREVRANIARSPNILVRLTVS